MLESFRPQRPRAEEPWKPKSFVALTFLYSDSVVVPGGGSRRPGESGSGPLPGVQVPARPCSESVRPGEAGKASATRTPPLRRPQPCGSQDQGRRPPSSTSQRFFASKETGAPLRSK